MKRKATFVICQDAYALAWLFGPMGWRLACYGNYDNAWELDE